MNHLFKNQIKTDVSYARLYVEPRYIGLLEPIDASVYGTSVNMFSKCKSLTRGGHWSHIWSTKAITTCKKIQKFAYHMEHKKIWKKLNNYKCK